MPKVISIPRVGNVQFPDEMGDQDIAQASGEVHDKAVLADVLRFAAQDPSFQGMKDSEVHKQIGSIAAVLEKFPRLIHALDAGAKGKAAALFNPVSQAAQAALQQLTHMFTEQDGLQPNPNHPSNMAAGSPLASQQ